MNGTRFEYTGASIGRVWTYRNGVFRKFAGYLCFCEDYAESVVLGKETAEQFNELNHPFYITVYRDNGKSLRVHPMYKDGVLPIARELARMTGQEIHVEFGDSITERVVVMIDGQIREVPSGAHIEKEYEEYYTL